jgi:hypothetical protein
MNHTGLASMAFLLSTAIAGVTGGPAHDSLHVLAPITHGNLTIFPIVGGVDYDTSRLLTLDEGVRAGTVIVTEQGSVQGLLRRGQPVNRGSGAAVNQLVLINNSDRPLLLLAGEIVAGGHQDRVIGADRLVLPNSDPIDLSVFCVEPGRWVGRSEQFNSMKSQMAQPSVRVPAMAAKDQHQVWNQVAEARKAVIASSQTVEVASAAPIASATPSLVTGDFTGTLTDPSGAVVPNATVTLRNNRTGATRTTTTNSNGSYRFSLMQPGSYTLGATASGFSKTETMATINAGQATVGDVRLAVGSSSQSVNMSAGVPLVQADNDTMLTNFDQNFVGNAPNGGNDLGHAVGGTTSYAQTMAIPKVQATIDNAVGNYESIREQLKRDGAKGVVVAINGKLVWVDLFASNDLLMRYWQKLVRSYAAESLTSSGEKGQVDQKSAQQFLSRMSGSREVVETEAGIYRRAEITGDNYKVFSITALMPKTDFDVHVAKMTYDPEAGKAFPPAIMVR